MARIVIIGGGIGGLAAAGCLRLWGIEADVYERAAELREVGAALGLWPNATRVLKRLGVLDELLQEAHIAPAGALRDQRGRVLRQMSVIATEVPAVFAHRADLHAALLAAIPRDRLHLNRTCTGLQRDGAGSASRVRAVFADGTWSEWADGIIGADGVRSVFREMTLHDGAPIYRGYVAWRGVAKFESSEEVVGETWGRGQRFGFIPLGSGRVGWWATANKPGDAGAAVAGTQAKWKSELSKRFGDWHAPIPAVLEATPEGAMLCNAISDRPAAARKWGEGPMTLLGDAAHPTTPNLGQGACLAIEDAAVLARCLAEIPDVSKAFRVYEATRFDRTATIVRESLKFGKIGQWENGLLCGLRVMMVRHASGMWMQRQFRDLWMYDAWEAPLASGA